MKVSKRAEAITAIILATFFGAVMGIWVRMLNSNYENLQQIALRALLGGVIGLLIYSNKIRWKSLKSVPKKDFAVITLRSLVLLSGIVLFTFAINNGNFANINFIYALPSTALLGVFFLKEKLTWTKISIIIVGVIGICLISINDFSNFTMVSLGEIAALLSTFLYSFSYIIRKWISPALNNQEIASIGSLITGFAALILSFFLNSNPGNYLNSSLDVVLIVIIAGITYIGIGYFNNLGFEHLDAITANNLLSLNVVFGLIISIVVYREIPTYQDLLGGVLVVASAILINYANKKLV